MTSRVVKTIKVDLDKCIACRACELACSAFHAKPRYGYVNPARSRIRLIMDYLNDQYIPMRATGYTKAECAGRNEYTIKGRAYSECSFCGASCPSRDAFKEPDSGLPLKCDMCENDNGEDPKCVTVCTAGALTLEERAIETPDEDQRDRIKELTEMEIGLQSLIDRFGRQSLEDTVIRMMQK